LKRSDEKTREARLSKSDIRISRPASTRFFHALRDARPRLASTMAAPPVPDPIDRRNLSVAFEDANPALAGQTFAPTPTAPTPTRTGKFRSDAISNDPAAYVGRELRPRNSAYTPIATRTTNGDLMGWKQPEVQCVNERLSSFAPRPNLPRDSTS
jgi:hypothetical protein